VGALHDALSDRVRITHLVDTLTHSYSVIMNNMLSHHNALDILNDPAAAAATVAAGSVKWRRVQTSGPLGVPWPD
jgi:hypothetical protein